MFKVALINPPFLKGAYRHQPSIPIGLAYLTAVLEANGHEARIIDCPPLGINSEQLQARIASFKPDMIGISSMTPIMESVLATAHAVKEVNIDTPVVLGGPHVTFMDENILREAPFVDIVVRGEGEQTLLELVQKISHLDDLHAVAGITFRRNGQVIRTEDRPFIQELDDLPYPALKHLPLDKYRIFGKMRLPIITSRGCPFQCSFCITSRVFGRKTRMRSPENVVNELEWLRNEYNAEAFAFYDDTFTLDKKRVYEICDKIQERRIDIPWDCATRVDQISRDLLATMRKAGCQLINLGIESACQPTLDAVNKGTSVEQNVRAIRWVKEAGISVATSTIIGYPGETLDSAKQTFDLIRRVEPDEAYICVATPYPGTDLYNLIRKMGWKMSPDWSLYDTIKPVFENPDLSGEKIEELRREFYSRFYSPLHILNELRKRNFYSRMFARTAFNHFFWRVRHRLLGARTIRQK